MSSEGTFRRDIVNVERMKLYYLEVVKMLMINLLNHVNII
jgi:hypothetical protein